MKTPDRGCTEMPVKPPKLAEIAERIGAHLKRFEADPKVNVRPHPDSRFEPYIGAWCKTGGRRAFVHYSFEDDVYSLTKADALAYLEWLDKGGVGKHWDAARKTVGERVREARNGWLSGKRITLHQRLIDAATKAIEDLFSDTSVAQEATNG